MTQQHILRALSVAVALFAVVPRTGSAQMFVPTGRDTLRGLPGVEVLVEELQPEVERHGVSHGAIRAEVTARLRARGIRVYGSQSENPSPANAYLYVHVNALELPRQEAYAVALQVQVRQTVRSVASVSQIVNAMTWDAHNVLSVPAGGFERLHAEIQRYVDLFIDDWIAVH